MLSEKHCLMSTSTSPLERIDDGNEIPIQRRFGRFAFDNLAAMPERGTHD